MNFCSRPTLPTLTACIGVIIALLIVSFSSNKVEGMALAKLRGLMLAGVSLPFFCGGSCRHYVVGATLYGQFKKKII